ncbi:hypothetical protein [Phocaeicola sp.]
MADLVTRLLLNSSQFDNNIRQSTQQVQQFQQVGRNITATIGKFAGVLGVAMTAGEAFNKWVHSSQVLGDEWDNTINACKGTIDVFFQSLSNGDWSAFQDGLFSTIKGLKELSALRDSLADAKLTMDFNTKRFEAQFTELEAVIRDKTKSLEERKKAFEQLQTLKADFKMDINDVSAGNDQALLKSLETQYKGYGWNTGDVEKYLSVYNNDFSSRPEKEALDKYKKELAELQKQQYSYSGYSTMYGSFTTKTENREITEKINLLKQQNRELEKMRILNNDDDKDRQQMLKDYEYSYDLRKRAADFDKRTLELQSALSSTGTGGSSNRVSIPEGSLADINNRLSLLNKQLTLEISPESRTRLYKEIQDLTERKRVIEFQYKYPNAPIGKLDGKSASLAGMVKPEMPASLPKFKNPITNKNIKLNNEYAESLGAIASVMGSVTNMTNEGAAAWLSWGANLISAVAAAIPQIVALTTAKKGEAIASGVASAAQTPFVGWLLAGAAAAAVVAALASIPSFSTGGIFAGNSTIGDMNLARVNAGEMILNNRQQKNLFNLLNGNGVIGSAGGGQVEFKIRGKELVGVLANYNNKTAKVK